MDRANLDQDCGGEERDGLEFEGHLLPLRVQARRADSLGECLAHLVLVDNRHRSYMAVDQVAPLEPELVALTFKVSPVLLAQSLSRVYPGQWWSGGAGVTWVNGRKIVWLVDWGQLEGVKEARRVAQTLGLPPRAWSVGGIARKLLAWIGPPDRPRQGTETLLTSLPRAFQTCSPGTWENARLVDIERAFHQFLVRLPSPKVTWLSGRPLWHPLAASEASRWRDLLTLVAGCRSLRHVTVGCMIGGGRSSGCFCRGERLPMRPPLGPFRTGGLTVVRACYEVTWAEVEASGAPYANTDSLLLPAHRSPQVWPKIGVTWRTVAEGPAEVRSMDCYKVGERETYWHAVGSRLVRPLPPSPAPSPLTYREWLA